MAKPVNIYTSTCCNAQATKQPCIKPRDKKDAETNSLGSWRCTQCKRPCLCTRTPVANVRAK